MLVRVCYLHDVFGTEGWLSGLKRRFAKPLYGIKACTEGSNPSPSANLLPYNVVNKLESELSDVET